MSEEIYYYNAEECIKCNGCSNAVAGSQVDVFLDTDLIPALPTSIRGIVQDVNNLVYSIQYETDDLLGAATELSDQIVTSIVCVSDLTLSKEYIDKIYGDLPEQVEEAIAGNRFIDMPDSANHVSKAYNLMYSSTLVTPNTQRSQYVDFNNDFLSGLPDEDYVVGRQYRVDIQVAITTEDSTNDSDSYAELVQIGVMGEGCTVFVKHKHVGGLDSLTTARAGESVNISLENVSETTSKMLHVQAQLQIFHAKF